MFAFGLKDGGRCRPFVSSEAGTVAVLFAMMLVPLLMMAGISIDLIRANAARQADQEALDLATVSVLSQKGPQASAADLNTLFKANGGAGDIQSVAITSQSGELKITSTAKVTAKTTFGWIAGVRKFDLPLQAEAKMPARLTQIQILPINASGWWGKTMSLYGILGDNPNPVLIGQIVYKPSSPYSSTGTMTSTFGNGYVPILNAKSLWFVIDIDPKSKGLWDGVKMQLRTNDPATSYYLFVDGVEMPKGVPVDLTKAVPCGKEVVHAWEDGGNFSDQDFFYKLTGNCELQAGGVAHLSK